MNTSRNKPRQCRLQAWTLSLAILPFAQFCWGQTPAENWNVATWKVVVDQEDLHNPWTGGLTAPQWSPLDADLDGVEDLFAFDRDGNRTMVFERIVSDEAQADLFTWRPDWSEGWPEMTGWCLLRDFNGDEKADIFTSHQNGIRVYTNITAPGGIPTFDPNPINLMAEFDLVNAEPTMLPVYCLSMDLPAILDHDDDGDLDIISFSDNSSTLNRFQGQTADGLDLKCTNLCYGKIAEASENNTLFIGEAFTEDQCGFNVENPGMALAANVARTGVHAGGAITSLQLQPNGPKDLILSDVTYPEAVGVVLEVGGSMLDSATFLDPEFPSHLYGDTAVHLPRFPAAYHLDVDGDGTRDLLFSPNSVLETDDDASVHFYRNAGSDEVPQWEFNTRTFLQEGMIDLGRGAYPTLHDFNQDGLLDLVVANKERYEGVAQTPAAVAFYRNIGSIDEPLFELDALNWIDLATYQIESPYPAFGDLDGDGDLDALVGDELGRIHRYTNVANPGDWPVFELAALAISDGETGEVIDVGQFATPQLLDMDSDGDLDMVVGEKNGTLTLFEGTGEGAFTKYISPVHGENWGNIVVDNVLGINGYSVPALTPTSEGIRVYVANEIGTVQDFGLASSNWDEELLEVDDAVFGPGQGLRAAATFADVNGDGVLDAFVGVQNGGLLAYASPEQSVSVADATITAHSWEWAVMPNPGQSVLKWSSADAWTGALEVWNVAGQKVASLPVHRAKRGSIDVVGWPAGTYLLRPFVDAGFGMGWQSKGVPVGTPLTWIKLPE